VTRNLVIWDVLTDPLVAVQNYITAILLFLVVEMLMTWGFYGTNQDPWNNARN
jgi:hypothetical protein